jgi:2-oxoglutarate dehydrogenase E1 component
MGAYRFALLKLRRLLPNLSVRGASRVESASPATGSSKAHVIEQRALLDEAFGPG